MLPHCLASLAFASCAFALFFPRIPIEVVLTNDDGWATSMIRATNDALLENGFDVVLSAPAENESGTGSSTAPATVLTEECEFDTCPVGAPAEGFNASDPHLNYVNSFPVDAVRFGIQTLAPKFFNGRKPEFVLSGPNVGNNLGPVILNSGTVGAATEAALEGIPSTAFSAATAEQISYTTLETNATSSLTLAARTYADLNLKFTQALLASPARPILPRNISINVNYPATTNCSTAHDFKFVLTRLNANASAVDVRTCGTDHLPAEATVVGSSGCFSSVSVFDASNKGDVDAKTQQFVLDRLGGFLSCFTTK